MPAPIATPSELPLLPEQRLLLNGENRARLAAAGLAAAAAGPLDLRTARRIGLWLGVSGSDLLLFALLNAALRSMTADYLARRGFQPGWSDFLSARRRQPLSGLGTLLLHGQQAYPHPAVAETALRREAPRRAAAAARTRVVGELFLLDVQLDNPATQPHRALFDDAELTARGPWRPPLQQLAELLADPAAPSPWGGNLRDLLREPLRAAPDNLAGQVAFVLAAWGGWLPPDLLRALRVAHAVALEEAQLRLPGPGPAGGADLAGPGSAEGPAAFSPDRDWMANAVLIAKSVSVWLDQLGRRYGTEIRTLDRIPDAELDRLAGWGFNALWLIGIWERSNASRRIKQLRGNPEAEASAYALHAYRVAADLGGEAALADLETRCLQRGIRLACDVVPNHTGIDSEWVRHHPDWFIQSDEPPYPGYRFTGPDLSEHPAISLRIEDGYWDHRDAAVVFEHVDHRSGRRRYLYHGNDGTHMPWNDTAQLNFLLPEVRQAMSDLIVAIARRFRLIRFDAAMTLARKHFRRLWFPPPGGSAGVPSRSAFWMENIDFDRAFPAEFWREVVDRIHAEAPDTLLIAEAFWLMESYFVRTLGMHRVYNSAFMNLLKQEENAKYRRILKDVLAFNPEILKRYVNFMSNPDEATAVEQFGTGDKYFGVAVLLATLPGLPMFGHGQVEGFREKYGMEYRRAYWDETPDESFVAHHERQIFPLLHRRRHFSGVDDFQMYDLVTGHGADEHVYAYSNGPDGERALVVYNNAPHATAGRLHHALPKAARGCEGVLGPGTTLTAQLGIDAGAAHRFLRFRDLRDGNEYLRPVDRLGEGLEIVLGPYHYHVFHAFRTVVDHDGSWAALYARIGDDPVADLDLALFRLRHQHLWTAWQQVTEPERLRALAGALRGTPLTTAARALTTDLDRELQALADLLGGPVTPAGLPPLHDDLALFAGWLNDPAAEPLLDCWQGPGNAAYPFLCWRLFARLEQHLAADRPLWPRLREVGLDLGWREGLAPERRAADLPLAVLLIETGRQAPPPALDAMALAALARSPALQGFLGINHHGGELWFNRERMQALIAALAFQAAHRAVLAAPAGNGPLLAAIVARAVDRLAQATAVNYRLEPFLRRDDAPPAGRLPARGKTARRNRSLRVLMVASEAAPFAKTGGLGDVLGTLPPALRAQGVDVRLVLPWYRSAREVAGTLRPLAQRIAVGLGAEDWSMRVRRGRHDGVPVYFLDVPELFDRSGLYGEGGRDYPDNDRRFALLGRGALELARTLGFAPDVVHAHDWQAALAVIDLRHRLWADPFFSGTGSLLTIHNLGYQGTFPPTVLADLGLGPDLFTIDGLEFHGLASLLKGGIRFADHVSTVSPTYCREIQTPAFGVGLDGLLRTRRQRLHGILNGLDGQRWNPAHDPCLPAPYAADHLAGKAVCKAALQQELGLQVDDRAPLAAMVTRLDRQKGLDLLLEAWEQVLARGLQLVLLGTGTPDYEQRFAQLAAQSPDRVAVIPRFDDGLARRIYAASDLFLMPSRYEPCGLGQLIALRYGSVPLVHATGGLADTIRDPRESPAEANGFVFHEFSVPALLATLDRLLAARELRDDWQTLVQRGMRQDFSWQRSAEDYLDLYRVIRRERQ
ncbi:MAG: glycogen synthase GlgA [Deltaproteobacteria bacterium]|nr:MAG: glycogen synthase GlgA [Deltaproteobacteria bacterium]